jgi:hypothetical protein
MRRSRSVKAGQGAIAQQESLGAAPDPGRASPCTHQGHSPWTHFLSVGFHSGRIAPARPYPWRHFIRGFFLLMT